MRKNNNTIEINGHRYDAQTGAGLTAGAPQQGSRVHSAVAGPARTAVKPAQHSIGRPAAKHPARHAPAPSRTLMRQAVKKPGPSLKRGHQAHGQVSAPVPQALSDVAVGPDRKLDERRLRRAKQVSRSRLISHFPPLTASRAVPVHVKTIDSKPGPDRPPLNAASQPPAVAPAPVKPQTTAEFLDQAIEQATSHLQPPPRRRRERLKRNLGAGAAIGLSVLLLGVIVVQNSANVRLQMASAKAGFNVSLPNYRPGGFALGQLNYSDGVAAAEFHNKDSHYTITQKPTTWDDLALRDNFVAPNYKQYQTVLARSLVIYIYGNHNASWVDGGIWYIIQTDGSLSDQQIIHLATSF